MEKFRRDLHDVVDFIVFGPLVIGIYALHAVAHFWNMAYLAVGKRINRGKK